MSEYPYLVQISWYVVEKFLVDWQRDPYRWYQEIDIQTELSERLKTIYRLIGEDIVTMKCQWKVEGMAEIQGFSRVTCEPSVRYTDEKGGIAWCCPDIVIWDDASNIEDYPHGIGSDWPILWACEIKYPPKKEENWDQEKLRYMVSQNRAKFGCWLKVYLERVERGNGIEWDRDKEEGRIWIGEARLPSNKKYKKQS